MADIHHTRTEQQQPDEPYLLRVRLRASERERERVGLRARERESESERKRKKEKEDDYKGERELEGGGRETYKYLCPWKTNKQLKQKIEILL